LYFGLFMASIIPLVLIYFKVAGRFVGVALLVIFVIYTYELARKRLPREEESLGKEKEKVQKYLIYVLIGVAGVVISSNFIVNSASNIAVQLGVPRLVIGATIVALGTSLPELATSISATRKGYLNIALGNIIGSGFINVTCILGVTLVGSQLALNVASFSNLVLFSLMTNLVLWYFMSSERIGRREGIILLFMYALFLTVSFGGYKT
ncbi:MAG: hypothetical protein QXH91_07405, partial [Candidatus Bathyarchaeia archaeon]